MLRLLAFVLALTLPNMAPGVEPDEMLEDPKLEARAREISKGLRCVVCLNQDIDSSNAGVARDLRLLVRERLLEGDTNEEAMAFIQARYGDYVLLKPPLNENTYILWFAPFAMLAGALGIGAVTLFHRRRKSVPDQLSEAEEMEVARFINDQLSEDRK
jgi:cytochrome c-type biogenesis protein CcmH